MDSDNLIRMANRIGEFFESMPDRPEALEGIANHIKKFWEPRMRQQLLDMMGSAASVDLKDVVRTAVEQNRALLQPAVAVPKSQAPASGH